MTWKAIILTFLALATIAFATEYPWMFAGGITAFAVLIWIGYKLDRVARAR